MLTCRRSLPGKWKQASPTQTAMIQQQQGHGQFGYRGTPQEDHAASVIQRNYRKHKFGGGGGGGGGGGKESSLHGVSGSAAAAEALHPHLQRQRHGSATAPHHLAVPSSRYVLMLSQYREPRSFSS